MSNDTAMAPAAPTPETLTIREFGGPLQAQEAVWCSVLPLNLKALAVAMIQHANNATGRGLTGQETMARYISLNARSVRRLQTELDEAWATGASPVRVTYHARKHNSDVYVVTMRKDAPRRLPALGVASTGDAAPLEHAVSTGDAAPHEHSSTGDGRPARPAMADPKGGLDRRPSAYKLLSTSTEVTEQKENQTIQAGASAAGAARAAGEAATQADACSTCSVGPGESCDANAAPHARTLCATAAAARGYAARKLARAAAGAARP